MQQIAYASVLITKIDFANIFERQIQTLITYFIDRYTHVFKQVIYYQSVCVLYREKKKKILYIYIIK